MLSYVHIPPFLLHRRGTHRGPFTPVGRPDVEEQVKMMDEERWLVDVVMRAVGIKRVADTFVGNDKVRGVSGGEKKRVTVAEMMASRSFVDCFDEISTGLDAATTVSNSPYWRSTLQRAQSFHEYIFASNQYTICKLLGEVTRMRGSVRIVSLLQPPPETVALFDEIILLDKGRILYAGPVDEVTAHFKELGYYQPERMDPADWLQSLPTKDGAQYISGLDKKAHLTNEQFVQKYNESPRGQEMINKLDDSVNADVIAQLTNDGKFNRRYANSTFRSIKIVLQRELTLWWRDKYARMAR